MGATGPTVAAYNQRLPPRAMRDTNALWVLLGLAGFAIGALSVMQDDSWWHLRAGQWITQHRSVPAFDPFSWEAEPPRPWPNHSWLGQVVFYAAYAAGGLPLLELVCGCALAAAVLLSVTAADRPAQQAFPFALAMLPWLWVVASVRAHLFTVALLALTLWLLCRRRFWPLPLVFLVWANLHGGVALGGLLMGLASVALLVWDRPVGLRLVGWTALSGLATLLTPMGPRLPLFLLESVERMRPLHLVEWMGPGFRLPQDIYFWLCAGALLGWSLWRVSRVSDTTTRMLGVASVVMFATAVTSARNVPLFLLIALPFSVRLLPHPVRPTEELPKRANLGVVLAAAALIAGLLLVAYRLPMQRLRWTPLTPAAQDQLRSLPEPIFNTYNTGGYLLWFFPERRVFIDSRQDPYPLQLLHDTIDAQRTGNYAALFEKHGFRSALLERGHRLENALFRDGWRVRYADGEFVVFEEPAFP
jgi:hypothetical protein